MIKSIRLSLLLALVPLAAHAQTGAPVPKLAQFDSAMKAIIAKYQVPGGQLAITYHGKLVYSRGFGKADTAAGSAVQPYSTFRLASISKSITSIAIMKLVEAGKLGLEDTVFGAKGILNDTAWQNIKDARVRNITVRHLLEHSAGWNRTINGDYVFMNLAVSAAMGGGMPADAVTVLRWILKEKNLDTAPGTQYQYSNVGFSFLGRIIEKLTGRKYEEYVRTEILLPLGITTMKLGLNLPADRLPNEVTYYDFPGASKGFSVYDGTTQVPWAYGGFNLEAFDSFGGWTASAEDLCKLLLAVDGFPTVPDILTPASIAAMTKPSATYQYYALGWSVNPVHNWWHIGSLNGTTTEIVRGNNEINWAVLFNTRNQNAAGLEGAMDQFVWDVIPKIASWPDSAVVSGIASRGTPTGGMVYAVRDGMVRIPAIGETPDFRLVGVDGKAEPIPYSRSGEAWVLDVRGVAPGIHFLHDGGRIAKVFKER